MTRTNATMKIRRYSELVFLTTYAERFNYLKLDGQVGVATFGFDRYLNQALYQSSEWRKIRRDIILRDNGCDMGLEDYPANKVVIHHINPITPEQIEARDPIIFDTDNLITVSYLTHNAIHYGDAELLPHLPIERKPGDTLLWRRLNER